MKTTTAVNRFAWLQNRIFKSSKLKASDRLVACALASYLNDKTLACFPKEATLAQATGLSERTVRNALNGLCKAGIIQKLSRAAGYLRNRNTYELIGVAEQQSKSDSTKAAAKTPATDSGVKPATDSGAILNTDIFKQEGKKPCAKPRRKVPSPCPPLIKQSPESIAAQWQRLSASPWSRLNAEVRVSEAIKRAGIDRVKAELDRLIHLNHRLPLPQLLDVLDTVGQIKPTQEPVAQKKLLGKVPEPWAIIAQDFIDHPQQQCPNPVAWLKQIKAVVDGRTIKLISPSACVRDQLRNRFSDLIEKIAARRGYEVVTA